MTDPHFLEYDAAFWEQHIIDHPHTEPLSPTEILLEINWNDPIERWALVRADLREARLESRPCSESRCIELWDPVTDENTGGYGPADCGCQN